MAYNSKFGIADPLVADIAKGVTVTTATSLMLGGRLPSVVEIAVPAAALTIYWYTVHQVLP